MTVTDIRKQNAQHKYLRDLFLHFRHKFVINGAMDDKPLKPYAVLTAVLKGPADSEVNNLI